MGMAKGTSKEVPFVLKKTLPALSHRGVSRETLRLLSVFRSGARIQNRDVAEVSGALGETQIRVGTPPSLPRAAFAGLCGSSSRPIRGRHSNDIASAECEVYGGDSLHQRHHAQSQRHCDWSDGGSIP